MLTAVFIFLVSTLAAGYLGFKGTDPKSIYIAKIVFFISLIVFVILLFVYFYYPAPVPQEEVNNPLM